MQTLSVTCVGNRVNNYVPSQARINVALLGTLTNILGNGHQQLCATLFDTDKSTPTLLIIGWTNIVPFIR